MADSKKGKSTLDVKVLVVGPKGAGKTALTNYIADAVQNADQPSLAPCRPTVGVRVVEFDQTINVKDGQKAHSVELWDVSGDRAYEGGWPAIQHGAHGIIFVYNAENTGEAAELEQWHKWFAQPLGMKDRRCLVFAHRKSIEGRIHKQSVPKCLGKVQAVTTTLQENQQSIKDEFRKFLAHVSTAASEIRERDEQSVLGN